MEKTRSQKGAITIGGVMAVILLLLIILLIMYLLNIGGTGKFKSASLKPATSVKHTGKNILYTVTVDLDALTSPSYAEKFVYAVTPT